ncbi:MAG: hypothetical protein AAFQ02_03545 [Bacteroidota bacterium]
MRVLCALMIIGMMTSCTSDVQRANITDPDIKYRGDTMFSHRRTLLRGELDSLCIASRDSLVEAYRDSLVVVRMAEIEKIIGPIR